MAKIMDADREHGKVLERDEEGKKGKERERSNEFISFTSSPPSPTNLLFSYLLVTQTPPDPHPCSRQSPDN
jgi:hypothetical protein